MGFFYPLLLQPGSGVSAEPALFWRKIKTGSVPGFAAWVGDRVEGRNKHKTALSTRPPFWELGPDRHSLYRTLLQEFKSQVALWLGGGQHPLSMPGFRTSEAFTDSVISVQSPSTSLLTWAAPGMRG